MYKGSRVEMSKHQFPHRNSRQLASEHDQGEKKAVSACLHCFPDTATYSLKTEIFIAPVGVLFDVSELSSGASPQ